MAVVSGPLMSMDASGSIAGSIVFSKWKGRNYVRRHAIPVNPQSGLQVSIRAMMKFLSQEWGKEPINPAPWIPIAEPHKISPFNAFIKQNMQRWGMFETPSIAWPAANTSIAPSAPGIAVAPGVRSLTLTITTGVNMPSWGWIVFRGAAAPAGVLSEVIAVIEVSAGTNVFVDHPLMPGTYHYKALGFMDDGKSGAISADSPGTCT